MCSLGAFMVGSFSTIGHVHLVRRRLTGSTGLGIGYERVYAWVMIKLTRSPFSWTLNARCPICVRNLVDKSVAQAADVRFLEALADSQAATQAIRTWCEVRKEAKWPRLGYWIDLRSSWTYDGVRR